MALARGAVRGRGATAAAVPGFLATGRIEGMRDYHEKLRAKLLENNPDRAHLVPENFMHDISDTRDARSIEESRKSQPQQRRLATAK